MYVKSFERIEKTERAVGEKALRLSEVFRERLPVPPGFVINSEGFGIFMKKNRMEEKISNLISDLNVDDYRRLSEVSGEIKRMFESSEMPDPLKKEIRDAYESLFVSREAKEVGGAALDFIRAGRDQINVAVRSSPITSPDSPFAGQTESVLNVQGFSKLLESVKFCWSSLYTPRAICYRKRKGFSDIPLAGIIVQRMVSSEKSGSVFTDNSSVIIEGAWGLGNAISNGIVLPDVYVLDKESGNEVEKKIGKKLWLYAKDALSGSTRKEPVLREKVNAQLLDSGELKKLFDMYMKVSSLYAQPQIIEWGMERGRAFLLQARSFPAREVGGETPEGKALMEGLNVSQGSVKGGIRIISNTGDFDRIADGDILATKILSPELFPFFSRIKGIVSDYGGFTSGLSFMCREFGIPCVTGLDTSSLNEGLEVSITNGKIYPGEDAGESEEEGVTATEIKVNLDFSGEFDLEGEVDGVGLLKPEYLFAGRDPFSLSRANPEELVGVFHRIGTIAKKFYPKTVWYRSFSVRSDQIEGEWKERNPLMGWRGIRRSLEEPEILKCEMEAIRRLYSQGLNNVGIILSFVTSVEEFRSAKNMIPFSIKLGIEVCTPSSALDIESFCREGVNNVLVNLPELTQFTLGVDRTNAKVSSIYSESSPPVMSLIGSVVRMCKNYGVGVSIFLERYDPEVIERLIRIGVNSISLNPEFIRMGKSMVSRMEKKMLLENLRERGEL